MISPKPSRNTLTTKTAATIAVNLAGVFYRDAGGVNYETMKSHVCPNNEYELFFFNGTKWRSIDYEIAAGNSLHVDDIPVNTLLWLRNYTRGTNERPFIISENGDIEWW